MVFNPNFNDISVIS